MGSSIHSLNSDKFKINFFKRILWFIFNIINNNIPSNVNIDTRHFSPKVSKEDWEKIHPKSSPSRALSDLFWLKIQWEKIEKELGNINVVDTGCGNGKYFNIINDFSADKIKQYTGLDIVRNKNWDNIKSKFKNTDFKVLEAGKNISDFFPENTNMFISQSAIEHFDDDLKYFIEIQKFIQKSSKNTIQIHIFPSAACLKKYLWHGVRQYTPRTIFKITELFNDSSTYSILYKLGCGKLNKIHFNYITKPLWIKKIDYRETKTQEYNELVKENIMTCKEDKHPSFYALVIHSNYTKKIFDDMF